jgi:hypothetical protein
MFKKGCFELGATIHPVVIKVRRKTHTQLQVTTYIADATRYNN